MKRFMMILSVAGLLMFAGCKCTPEQAAEKHFKKTIKAHGNIATENLKITTIKADDKEALVKVEADLKYAQELKIVLENGKWVVKK